MLLAISTTRGIQSESLRERLRLIGDAALERRHVRRPVLAAAAATEAQVQAALLLGEDPDRDVQPADERVEIGAEDGGPVLADVAQLAGQRGRDVAGRGPQQLDELGARPVGELQAPVGVEGPLEPGDQRRRSASPRGGRCRRRARAAAPGPGSRWRSASAAAPRGGATGGSGSGPTPGNAAANRSRTRSASSPRSRRMSRSAPAIAPAPSASNRGGQQVRDLVEQAERHDLAGPDRRRPRRPDRVHPRGEMPDRGEVGDDEVAAGAEERVVDRVALARRPAHMELAHRPEGWHAVPACVRPRAPRSVGRRRRGRWRGGAARARTGRTRRSMTGRAPVG